MFCPKCGNADQPPGTYCRRCGEFLCDPAKRNGYEATPEAQLTSSIILHIMTAAVSLTLAIWLYRVYLGRENTPAAIYVTAAFLLAICGWQIQPLLTAFRLRNRFKRRKDLSAKSSNQNTFGEAKTKELLPKADFSSIVPPAVTENTTRKLDKIRR